MLGQAANPMLAKAEQAVQSKVPQQFQGALAKVVHAGLSIMYDPSLKPQMMKRFSGQNNPVQDAADGAIRMVGRLYTMSNKTMPGQIAAPAAMTFAFEYLDLAAKLGKVQITPDLISQTAQATGDAMIKMMGVSQDKLSQMVQAGKQKQAQPGIIGQAQGV